MADNPFSAGRWVSGDQFFGREGLIADLMRTAEPCNWVIGKRRMGKTSLLRELERRINGSGDGRLALFWDLQGSYDAMGLFDSLFDAVEDSRDLYPASWEDLPFEPEDNGDSPALLKKLSRALTRSGRRLILLMDETEELMTIGRQNPGLLSKLRRFMQTRTNTQTVMVSSPRLEHLNDSVEMDTSPFLHGFYVYYLGNFDRGESHALLSTGLGDEAVISRITTLTDGNPFETQLIAKHFFEEGDLDKTLLELETNPTLEQTIEVNVNLLTEDEREILEAVHCGPAPMRDFEMAVTSKLVRMGYLRTEGQTWVISSYFTQKWFANNLMEKAERTGSPAKKTENSTLLSRSDPNSILRQVLAIYQSLLEQAQQGNEIQQIDGSYLTRQVDRFDFEPSMLNLRPTDNDHPPWWTALEGTSGFLRDHIAADHSWSVYRFHQMVAKGPGHYSEKEFLDLMVLISEEASLS